MGVAFRVADGGSQEVSQRLALVQGDCGAARCRQGLSCACGAARRSHARLRSAASRGMAPSSDNWGERGHEMAREGGFAGVIAPVLTPFGEDGNPDGERFTEHAQWLLATGCTALAPFGTTSEANSLGLDERMELLEELLDDGVDPAQLMPGPGRCSVCDASLPT